MGQSFSAQVFKVKVRMLPDRCTLCINKVTNQVKQEKRKVASLLAAGEDESARFTAQGILFLEKKIMIYRLLMLAGQHLGQHYGAIERAQNQCPPDLVDSCAALIYASQRISEVSEAMDIAQQLALKFGAEWVRTHVDNHSGRVNPTLVSLFTPPNPPYQEMVDYLHTIASEHSVTWKPKEGVWDPQVLGTIAPFPEPAAVPDEYAKGLPSPTKPGKPGDRTPPSGPAPSGPPSGGYAAPVPHHASHAHRDNCPECLAGVPLCTDPNCAGNHPHIPGDNPPGGYNGGMAYPQTYAASAQQQIPGDYVPAAGYAAPASGYPANPYASTTSQSSSYYPPVPAPATAFPPATAAPATSYTPAAPSRPAPAYDTATGGDVVPSKEMPPPPTYDAAVAAGSEQSEEDAVLKLPSPPTNTARDRRGSGAEGGGGQFDGLSEDDLISRLKNL